MIKDQFDDAADWFVAHLAKWEVLRHGFVTVESPEHKRTRIGIVAAFLRNDIWNRPDGLLPRLGDRSAISSPAVSERLGDG